MAHRGAFSGCFLNFFAIRLISAQLTEEVFPMCLPSKRGCAATEIYLRDSA